MLLAHLAALAQHVQLLQTVSAQVPQGPLSQQEVVVGLAHQREAQALHPQPQSARLLGERLSGSQAHHSAVGLLQGQSLLPGDRLQRRPTRSLPGQADGAPDLSDSTRKYTHKHLLETEGHFYIDHTLPQKCWWRSLQVMVTSQHCVEIFYPEITLFDAIF